MLVLKIIRKIINLTPVVMVNVYSDGFYEYTKLLLGPETRSNIAGRI